MDGHIFPDHKFLPTYSTDRPAPIPNRVESNSSDIQQPLTCPLNSRSTLDEEPLTSSTFISPKKIRPFQERHKPKRLCYDFDDDIDTNNALHRILAERTEEYDELDVIQDDIDHDMVVIQAYLRDSGVETIGVYDFLFFRCQCKKSNSFLC
ncbi:unnamed protein product [Lepeophtheirus salmonis]|uniref:(salmon louse) hypothetical protein n=1 Tax=Lepeophtheirus salmonis TaxID=72036 RepID=A0A7R8D0C9_LEPSM|nr:unnamed protein product [Lepeophtheirus salmonis]CAF2982658.1 unnamed protein product [Lepeophtheirus salmonis]